MIKRFLAVVVAVLTLLAPSGVRTQGAQTQYDLLLKGGHVIDPQNRIDRNMDVAVLAGKIAAVAENIAASQATQTIDVAGLYVTPGLVDMHVHVYAGTGIANEYNGDRSVYPDGFTFRSGSRPLSISARPDGVRSRTSSSA